MGRDAKRGNDLIPARAQLRSSLEERRLRHVSKDVPHGGLMVRDGARAPPHHEGRTFRVAKYAGQESCFCLLRFRATG